MCSKQEILFFNVQKNNENYAQTRTEHKHDFPTGKNKTENTIIHKDNQDLK